MPKDLLTIAEAAKRVGRAESTIRRWERDGLLTVFAGLVDERELLQAEKRARTRNPAGRRTPLVALAREIGIEPDVLREELRALVMRRK